MDKEDLENEIAYSKRKEAKAKYEQIYKENSKRRLMSIIDKKFTTTMIGCLSVIEETFGELWGHKSKNPTKEQERMRVVWEEARNNILNNGNKQRRAAQDEIANHTFSWDKYKTELIVKRGNND